MKKIITLMLIALSSILLISGGVADKVITEPCKPLIQTDKIYNYKTCTHKAVYNPSNGTTTKAYNYRCIDYIEYKETQIDCIKNGVVDVSGKTYSNEKYFCKVIGDEVCCASHIDGGKYALWNRRDGSVDIQCQNINTNKITAFDETKKEILR